MKKLLITVAAVAFGLAASAATVDWRYKITNANAKNLYSGYTVYLVDATAWDLAKATGIKTETFSDAAIVKDSATFNNGKGNVTAGAVVYTTVNAEGAANDRAVDISDLAKGSSRDFYYIVLNTNKNPGEWSNVASVTLTGRASDDNPELGPGRSEATQAAFTAGTWTPVGAGPTPVPEPTTGLLVLAGLAGLALRRRRA